MFHPLLVPALCLAAGLVVVTLARPELGVGAWFVMMPLSRLGALGDPPWIVGAAWAAFLFSLALARHSTANDRDSRFPPLTLLYLLFLLVTLVGALRSTDLGDALPAVRTTITGGFMFFAVAMLVRDRRGVMTILASVAFAASISGLAAVYEWETGGSTFGFITTSGALVARVAAGFGQPNQLAGFLIVLLPLILTGVFVARRGRLLFAAAGVIAVAGVYLSFSRAGLLAIVVIPFAFMGVRAALMLAPVTIVPLLILAPGLLRERFATLSSEGSELASRLDFWTTAWAIWQDHLVFGVGPGGFGDAYASARVPGKEFLPTTLFQPPPHAHNLELQFLAEQGIVGLGVFAAIIVLAVAALVRLRSDGERWVRMTARGLLAAFAALVVHNQFDVTLLEGTGEFVWGLLGLVAGLTLMRRVTPGVAPPA
jgi:O-antigen ligase